MNKAPKSLSKRELELMEMFSLGYSMKEVSTMLYVSIHTVDTHRRHVIKKLGARNMTHAVTLAFRKGLLANDDMELQ